MVAGRTAWRRSDAAGYDSVLGLAFSSNGEGTLTIVKRVNGTYEPVETVTTERGARTMAVDEKAHRVYLLSGSTGPTVVVQTPLAFLVIGFDPKNNRLTWLASGARSRNVIERSGLTS